MREEKIKRERPKTLSTTKKVKKIILVKKEETPLEEKEKNKFMQIMETKANSRDKRTKIFFLKNLKYIVKEEKKIIQKSKIFFWIFSIQN